jgi:protein-S-isoprenylcysteine O-methyltransferase Ste14
MAAAGNDNISSAVVRVQKERAQTVISTGPYRYVRHPMYTGARLFFLGTSFLLGSWYGVLCTPVFIGLFAVRAVLEERLLRVELEGYDAYVARVKYRFFPHVW